MVSKVIRELKFVKISTEESAIALPALPRDRLCCVP